MNFIGKILVVVILVASLLLMAFAILVYSAHTNWRDAYEKLNVKLTAEQQSNVELTSKYENQIVLLAAEKEAFQQDVRKLESERTTLVELNAAIQSEVDGLQAERRRIEAMVAATEENNNRLMDEVVALRKGIRENEQARDEAFATTLKATSDLHVATGNLEQLTERNSQLVQQVSHTTSALRENGVDPNGKVVPRVRGLIRQTQVRDGAQLIEITLGSDDGIQPGHTIEVFRGERYLGRAVILKTDPDHAVGRVIRELQQGHIQEGDDVATKLRVG